MLLRPLPSIERTKCGPQRRVHSFLSCHWILLEVQLSDLSPRVLRTPSFAFSSSWRADALELFGQWLSARLRQERRRDESEDIDHRDHHGGLAEAAEIRDQGDEAAAISVMALLQKLQRQRFATEVVAGVEQDRTIGDGDDLRHQRAQDYVIAGLAPGWADLPFTVRVVRDVMKILKQASVLKLNRSMP